jgi:peptidyl-prolyl cis-trans isomerase C
MTKSRRPLAERSGARAGPCKTPAARTEDDRDLRRPRLTVNQATLRLKGVALAALLAAACGAPDARVEAPSTAGVQEAAPPTPELLFALDEVASDADIAARVGDTVITYGEVRREAAARDLTAEPDLLHPAAPDFERVLEDLIDQRLLALEAARLELHQDLEARRRLAAAQERILGNILVETVVSDAVTDEAVQRVYEEQRRLAPAEIELRARHILVATREEADEVARLLAEGTDFGQLASRVSQDPATRLEGGDLGYFTRGGILPAFAEVAFNTAEDEVSAPFQTEYGWHVLMVTDRRRQAQPGLDERRADIVRFLTLQGIDGLLSQIRESYPVTLAPAPDQEPAGQDGGESEAGVGDEADQTAPDQDG